MACLVIVVDLTSWPYFFMGAAVGLTVGLTIGRAMSAGREILIGFFGLSLW